MRLADEDCQQSSIYMGLLRQKDLGVSRLYECNQNNQCRLLRAIISVRKYPR